MPKVSTRAVAAEPVEYTDVAARKKKNADAQAAFRMRRANYISTLEETVTNLESVILELQEGSRQTRTESDALKQENTSLRQELSRLRSAWQSATGTLPIPSRPTTGTRSEDSNGATGSQLSASQPLPTSSSLPYVMDNSPFGSSASGYSASYQGHSPTLTVGEDGTPQYAACFTDDPLDYAPKVSYVYPASRSGSNSPSSTYASHGPSPTPLHPPYLNSSIPSTLSGTANPSTARQLDSKATVNPLIHSRSPSPSLSSTLQIIKAQSFGGLRRPRVKGSRKRGAGSGGEEDGPAPTSRPTKRRRRSEDEYDDDSDI